MNKKKIVSELIFVIFLLVLVFPAAASGRAEKPVFAYQDRIGDAAAVLAADVLANDGVFEVKRFSSGGLTAEALISGTADIATMGDAVAVKLASRYPETVLLLGVHGEGAERHRLAYTTDEPSEIAVKFGTSTHAALLEWLRDNEDPLGMDAPKLIDMSPGMQLSALGAGEVDAIAASEPTISIAADRIADCRTVSLEAPGRMYPLLLVATRKSMEKYPAEIDRLVEELRAQEENIPLRLELLSEVTGLEEGLLNKSLGFHSFGYHSVISYLDELSGLATFLMQEGMISRIPDWNKVLIIDD